MIIRALIAALLIISPPALAIEAGEFHLYGINKAGLAFDITPHEGWVGDPDKSQGLTSQFVMWLKSEETVTLNPKPDRICTATDLTRQCLRWEFMRRLGRCTVWLAPSYRVVCVRDGQPLSGVTYVGEKVGVSRIQKISDARKLYESFLRRYDGASPGVAAVYRCKEGCTASLPPTLIFLWLGD